MIAFVRAGALALIAIAAAHVSPAPSFAQPTPGEYRCGAGNAKTFARFIQRKSKCVQRCVTHARRSSQLYGDCFAPFGGRTASCILDPVTGVEARARASIVRACTDGCPACYNPTICTTGEPSVTNVEVQLDILASTFVYCVEGAGATSNPAEAVCEDAVARAVSDFGAARIRCYSRCFAGIHARSCPTCTSGQLPVGVCDPPVSDPRAAACLARAEAKAAALIDASCSAVGANPTCYVNNGFDTGAAWVGFMGAAIDGQVLNVSCGL
jgi:hypothetical protein